MGNSISLLQIADTHIQEIFGDQVFSIEDYKIRFDFIVQRVKDTVGELDILLLSGDLLDSSYLADEKRKAAYINSFVDLIENLPFNANSVIVHTYGNHDIHRSSLVNENLIAHCADTTNTRSGTAFQISGLIGEYNSMSKSFKRYKLNVQNFNLLYQHYNSTIKNLIRNCADELGIGFFDWHNVMSFAKEDFTIDIANINGSFLSPFKWTNVKRHHNYLSTGRLDSDIKWSKDSQLRVINTHYPWWQYFIQERENGYFSKLLKECHMYFHGHIHLPDQTRILDLYKEAKQHYNINSFSTGGLTRELDSDNREKQSSYTFIPMKFTKIDENYIDTTLYPSNFGDEGIDKISSNPKNKVPRIFIGEPLNNRTVNRQVEKRLSELYSKQERHPLVGEQR